MNDWVTLRKTPLDIYVEYGSTPGNRLSAEDIRVTTLPEFAISLDLNGNLHKRNKQCSSYQDARVLASGRIKDLHLVQIDHRRLIEQIFQACKSTGSSRTEWNLTIELEGVTSFRVKPQLKLGSSSLFLNVLQKESEGV